ncbi:hypothetical protein BHE74_00053074 [Ensete ventricosum]|nr:hypothetical protein BHE74_00053074 [Ensete ventricosum]
MSMLGLGCHFGAGFPSDLVKLFLQGKIFARVVGPKVLMRPDGNCAASDTVKFWVYPLICDMLLMFRRGPLLSLSFLPLPKGVGFPKTSRKRGEGSFRVDITE